MIALDETLFAFQTTEMYDIIMCFIDKEKKHGRISKVYAEIFDVILKDMSASNMNEILKMLHENTSIKDDKSLFIKGVNKKKITRTTHPRGGEAASCRAAARSGAASRQRAPGRGAARSRGSTRRIAARQARSARAAPPRPCH